MIIIIIIIIITTTTDMWTGRGFRKRVDQTISCVILSKATVLLLPSKESDTGLEQ